MGAFTRRESWGRDIVVLSRELLGDGLITTIFNFMVYFNSLSCFFFSKNNLKSDFGRTVVFIFLAGFVVWAGLVLVVGSWFGFFFVSGIGVVFISFVWFFALVSLHVLCSGLVGLLVSCQGLVSFFSGSGFALNWFLLCFYMIVQGVSKGVVFLVRVNVWFCFGWFAAS